MIKVLNIISDTNIGGAGRVIENYLACRDSDRFDVSVALPSGSLLIPKLKPFGIHIYEVDAMRDRSFDMKAVKKLVEVIKREDPDIVHTHGAFSGRIAGKRCGKHVVVTRHSAFPLSERTKKFPFRQIYKYLNERYADRIIAVSPVCRDYITEVGVREDMIDVLINGVEHVPETTPEKREELRKRLGIENGVFTAGIIARLEPYKGHAYVIEAAKDLKAEGRKFCIIAAGTGSLYDELRAKAEEAGVSDTVLFPGFVEDMPTIWSLLDIQINASYVEATSLAVLEGMSAGIPAVVSDCGGNPDIIRNGIDGFVFPMHDSHRLAECIAKMMDDGELRAKMGRSARERYNAEYTGGAFARRLEDIYGKIMGGND